MNDKTSIARRLSALSVSGLSDALGGVGVLSPGLQRFSGSGTVAGQALTADCAEGALGAVFVVLEQAQAGDVLCMTAPGHTAYLGDLLATNLSQRGLAAVVVDGNIRDKDTIAGIPVSIFARGLSPVALRHPDRGQSMVPIVLGGVTVSPGDWVVADSDGVIAIAPDQVEAALAKAEEGARIEQRIMQRIQAGEKVMDAVRAEVGGR